jgi:hypothetical protein
MSLPEPVFGRPVMGTALVSLQILLFPLLEARVDGANALGLGVWSLEHGGEWSLAHGAPGAWLLAHGGAWSLAHGAPGAWSLAHGRWRMEENGR